MKQTNSAIKFLLAQYRAIFKHAQLASILAIATAAGLSINPANAGQVAAQDVTNQNLSTLSGPITVDGTGQTDDTKPLTYKDLTLVGTEDRPTTGLPDVQITITSGAGHTIKGVAEVKDPSAAPAKPYIDLGSSSITIDTNGATAASLTIGAKGAETHVFMGDLAVNSGSLTIGDDTATSVNAAAVSLGAESKTATVDVKDKATLAGSGILSVNEGATLKIASGGTAYGSSTTVAGGTVALGTASGQEAGVLGKTGNTTVSSGKVTVAATAVGALKGAQINLEGTGEIENSGSLTIGESGSVFTMSSGTITNDAKSLIFAGATKLNGGSIKNKGTVEFNGTTTVGENVLANVDNAAVWQIGNAKVSLSTKTLAAMKTGTTAKIVASGAKADDVSELEISGDAVLNLGGASAQGSATETDLEFIDSKNGQLGAKFANSGTGVFKLSANKASYTQGSTITGDKKDLALQIGSLELGNGTADFSLGAKAAVTVTDNLSVKAKADGTAYSLLISGGKLTLSDTAATPKAADSKKTVSAKQISVGDQNASGSLVVSKGTWGISGLDIVSGDATVEDGASLVVSGGVFKSAGGANNLKIKGGDVNAKDASALDLKKDGVAITNGGSLTLSADKVVKAADGSLVSGYASGAVTGSTDAMLTLLSSGDESISMTVENYSKFRTAAGFKGIIDIKLSDTPKAEESMPLDGQGSVIAGVTNGYEKTQAQVSGDVTDNYYVGNVKVTNGNNLSLGADGALTLSNANANNSKGQYVTNKDGGVGSVSFTTASNTLTLAGEGGKIGC